LSFRNTAATADALRQRTQDAPPTLKTTTKKTTANQGIGKEVARQLAAQGLTVVATARDPKKGEEAVTELQADPEVVAAGGRVVLFAPLDISAASTVSALAQALKPDAPVAILVNNAGLAYKGDAWGVEEARRTLDVNFRGTRQVVRSLLPLMRETCSGKPSMLPRVVNVTSSAGGLGMFDRASSAASADLKRRFLAAGEESDEARGDVLLDDLASEFEQGVADNSWKQSGWPGTMYGVSKALENAYGRQLARRGGGGGNDEGFVSINVHPGYISTSMSSYRGPLPPSRGADTIVWASLLPPDEARRASGAFFHDRQEREY
jgi:carbonyl reductase 1